MGRRTDLISVGRIKTAGTERDLAMAVSVGRMFQSTILQVEGGGGGGRPC